MAWSYGPDGAAGPAFTGQLQTRAHRRVQPGETTRTPQGKSPMATIDDKQAAARQALGKLGGLMAKIPAAHRNDPGELELWLAGAMQMSGLRPVVQNAVGDALVQVREWREAADQEQELARLYHDPRVRKAAEAPGKSLDWYWQRPGEAIRALRELSHANPGLLDKSLVDRAMNAAYAAREYDSENNIEEPDALGPVPTNAVERESEIAELKQKSIRGKLTKLEDQRYNQLLEARIEKEQAAEEKALADYQAERPAGPQRASEIEVLRNKSIRGKLSPAEDQRYNDLLMAREIAAGRMEPPEADTGHEAETQE